MKCLKANISSFVLISDLQLSALCKKLDDIWAENQGFEVLFLWTSFLKDEALSFLDIQSPLEISQVVEKHPHQKHLTNGPSSGSSDPQSSDDVLHTTEKRQRSSALLEADIKCIDSRAVQDIGSQDLLYPVLLEYDKVQRQNVFLMTLFMCGVCFNEKLGSQCMKFPGCDHVYCKDCMAAYFRLQISEGNVLCLVCPSDNCQSEAHPVQVNAF